MRLFQPVEFEQAVFSKVKELSFHRANDQDARAVLKTYFTGENLSLFSTAFLSSVENRLMSEGRVYGFMGQNAGMLPRTSSACQHHGDDQAFLMACKKIVNNIRAEKADRNESNPTLAS